MLSVNVPESEASICYFSLEPAAFDNHFSSETPLHSPVSNRTETSADPSNPLLARRNSEVLFTPVSPLLNAASTILQMQTAAAHGRGQSRPQPFPVQNVLHVTSDDWSSSDSSSSGTSSSPASTTPAFESAKSSLDLARCSRCQRTPSIDVKTGKSNMVQYGMNSWYCNRCAAMVGLNR